MLHKTKTKNNNLLISCAILVTALLVTTAQANAAERKFMPLGKNSAASASISQQGGRQFIPLREAGRQTTQAKMMPLNGGNGGKVWKLKDLGETPRIPKSHEVPDDVKLAMATGYTPRAEGSEGAISAMRKDREEIAAALAPVFAEKLADSVEETLDTDFELPMAVAEGMADKVEDAVKKGLGFVWPVAHEYFTISSPFGPRRHPVTGKQDFHAGIDIPAPMGTPVLAAASGEVAGVGEHPRLGRYVKITHGDGSYSLYGHLQKWTVAMGKQVQAGERIGLVGSTGRSTGPHLDFSIRKDGKPYNPMKVLAEALDEKKLALAR